MKISWTNKKICSKKSEISGTGVYAISKIEKGERIAVFGGFTADFDELEQMKNTNPEAYECFLEIGIQIDVDIIYSPISKDTYSDIEFLNHSCEPNAGFSGELHLVAMRDIESGEEITMDYAMCISSDIFAMYCECGREKCRSYISENDWKDANLQKKYGDFFQPYLKRMIADNK